MEERGRSEVFLSSDTTTPALSTEVTGENANNEPLDKTCPLEMLILNWVILIIAVVGLAGNAVVLWLLGFRMHRNAISVYVLNLAAADFLLLCCLIMSSLYQIIQKLPSFFSMKFFIPVMGCAYIAGLSILSAISTERCLSVLSPIWYRCRRPRRTSAVVCALLWALALLSSIMHSNYCDILHFKYDWCPTFGFFSITYLVFLFVTLAGSSLALLVRMFCGSRRMPLTRLYVTVLLTVLVFLLCGLPPGIHNSLIFLNPVKLPDLYCHYILYLFFLSSVNSCANPIIYFFIGSFRQRQRQTLKLVLQRALQDTPEVGEGGGSLPQGTQMSVSRGEQ